ncbi:MAG: hypothetical protein A4E35_01283 [Methanoregula sp. PtaU1.Bin051]|nr:MAG: hypothetical protein A4E35_01283 [Methanoregula sp. PtaU1.Bin051]
MDGLLREAIARLAGPGQVIEVRALSDQHTHSGYFSDPDALVRAVEPLDVDPSVTGIYVTLNEVNPALLSRRANRIKLRLSRKDATTSDADIVRRRWLPIDIDPVRPSGVSSTDSEHGFALAKADAIAAWLASLGFPEPVRADSGNGAHLLYRIDLPNDEAATALTKGCLAALDTLFSDGQVTVDAANFNAGRIWKLYGTVSRKGDSTPERPHRRSRILSAPDVPQIAGRALLEQLAARLPAEEQGEKPAAKGKGFDLRGWLSQHGFATRSEKPYSGGTLFVFDQCPFSSAHKDGAFAIQFGNGAVFAGCKHTSCGGGVQRWAELRARYEPDRAAKRKDWEQRQKHWGKERAKAKVENEGTGPALPAAPPDARTAALDVLEHGDPVALMLKAFAQEHVGDEILARCLILSMASQAVKNSDGLHVSVTGDSGKGKTHAFKKMLRQVPDRYKVKGTVSNKALYYMKDLAPRSVLMSDDTELSDGIQEILKSATSNFHEPITHTTVTKDLTCRVCTIPERCVWWIAKKEGTGDDQVMNRMLTCWIDESPEQDARVLAAKQAKERQEPGALPDETPELATCRAVWEILHEQMVWVVIPFSERIRFHAISNRRNPDMLYDLIKSHAALFFLQREQKTAEDRTLCIYAGEADFAAANEVFAQLSGTSGGQESKLTRREADLLTAIQKADRPEFTIQDLQELTGWSYSSIYRTLKGYDSRGKNYTGLLEKCPAISFTDRTVTMSEEEGVSVRRRTEAFAWNRGIYRNWMTGGPCWLDRGPGDGGNGDGSNGSSNNGSGNNGSNESGTGSFAALQHVSSSFAANAEKMNGAPGSSGSPKGDDNNKNSFLREGTFQQNGNTATQESSGSDPAQCVKNAANAANENRSSQKPAQNEKPALYRAPIVCSSGTQPAANVQETRAPATATPGPPRTIRAKDYKPLEPPEPQTACYVCGKKGSWYVEKFTAERRARPKDQQDARRICRSCYKEQVRAEQEASVPLPGTFDMARCERVTVGVGKCSVCGLERAAWIDRQAGVKLCEHCYSRETRSLSTRGVAV